MGAVLAEQPDPAVRDIHQRVTKYVATSTSLDRDWANATVLDGGLVEFVRLAIDSARIYLITARSGAAGHHAHVRDEYSLLPDRVRG
ncbi:MAG: hypothetical protein ACXVW7_10745 [Trebonia sp.]